MDSLNKEVYLKLMADKLASFGKVPYVEQDTSDFTKKCRRHVIVQGRNLHLANNLLGSVLQENVTMAREHLFSELPYLFMSGMSGRLNVVHDSIATIMYAKLHLENVSTFNPNWRLEVTNVIRVALDSYRNAVKALALYGEQLHPTDRSHLLREVTYPVTALNGEWAEFCNVVDKSTTVSQSLQAMSCVDTSNEEVFIEECYKMSRRLELSKYRYGEDGMSNLTSNIHEVSHDIKLLLKSNGDIDVAGTMSNLDMNNHPSCWKFIDEIGDCVYMLAGMSNTQLLYGPLFAMNFLRTDDGAVVMNSLVRNWLFTTPTMTYDSEVELIEDTMPTVFASRMHPIFTARGGYGVLHKLLRQRWRNNYIDFSRTQGTAFDREHTSIWNVGNPDLQKLTLDIQALSGPISKVLRGDLDYTRAAEGDEEEALFNEAEFKMITKEINDGFPMLPRAVYAASDLIDVSSMLGMPMIDVMLFNLIKLHKRMSTNTIHDVNR